MPADEDKSWVGIQFGSGDLEGYFMEDHCLVGDPTDPENNSLTIEKFDFGAVTDESVFTANFDAIIGLAYPEMASDGIEPFFDAMMREKVLDKNVFAFYMAMNPFIEDDGS